jgi:hypothetical protein
MKDFIPLLFLVLACGYIVVPGVVLWVIAVYATFCEMLWRAPVRLCGVFCQMRTLLRHSASR